MANERHIVSIVAALLLTGCTISTSEPGGSAEPIGVGTAGRGVTIDAPSAGPTLPGFCKPEAVRARVSSLAEGITLGLAEKVSAQFTNGVLNWEVYLVRPTGGVFRTEGELRAFVARLHADNTQWRVADVDAPSGDAGLPESAVYGATIVIKDSRGSTSSPMKLVIDCKDGGIVRAVGPES